MKLVHQLFIIISLLSDSPILQSTQNQPTQPTQISRFDSIDSTDAKEETKTSDSSNKIETSNSETQNMETDNITIKLKYINDDVRIVDGRLEELLGDFKRLT